MSVDATPARFRQEVLAARRMIEQVSQLGVRPQNLAADKAYGSGEFLAWLLARDIQPHIPVIDRRHQTRGRFTRDAFRYQPQENAYYCPEGKPLHYRGQRRSSQGYLYRSTGAQCQGCPHQDDPLILREAILMLSVERFGLEKFGFQRNPPWILRRLYGLDHEDAAPFGTIFHMYLNCAQSEGQPENSVSQADVESEEDRKNQILKILDDEIRRLEELREQSLALCFERIEYNKLTHLVPPPAVSERLLRYETHLSREFDRTLAPNSTTYVVQQTGEGEIAKRTQLSAMSPTI